MEADYGIYIQEKGKLIVPKNNVYNFGKGDFTITVLFQTTQPGTLVSRKSTEGGSSSNAGWLLILKPDGIIKMATDNGFGFYEVNSEPTSALDGTWHSVAAVRQNGMISIFFDGDPISATPRSSLPTPLDISNDLRIVIGHCDQQQEPYKQFVGVLEDVSLWNRALNQYEIQRTMFNNVTPEDSGLVGFWEMNRNFDDTSRTNNPIAPTGPASWMPVFHCVWAEAANAYSYCAIDLHEDIVTDYGAEINNGGGMITLPPNNTYNFGTGDFTVSALFQTTQPGTIISRKSTEGGSSDCAGWLLVIKPNGVFKMTTDNGFGFYEVNSEPTSALDGTWHSVAAIRKNGAIAIYFDGTLLSVTPHSSLPTPLNISNSRRIVIGNCDQQQEPYRQFIGIVEDVTIWNRALEEAYIQRIRFNEITPKDPGLVGFWQMDQNLYDASPTKNNGSILGNVQFVEVTHQAKRQQGLKIKSGTGYLYGAAIDKSKTDGSFPKDALVQVFRPDGTQLDRESNTDDLVVHMKGNSVWAFVVKNPQAGDWRFHVECPTSVPIMLSIQTTPTQDIALTIGNALQELYGKVPASHARLLLAKKGTEALALFSWHWSNVAKWAGLTLSAVAMVVAVGAVVAGAAIMSPVVLGASAAVLVGSIIVNIALECDLLGGSLEVADGMGLQTQTFGGTDQGEFSLVVDGRAYFPLLRNLLLAVQAGHYEESGITLPANPTFKNLIEGISSAGKKAHVLLWDTSVIQHMMETNDFLKYYLRIWLASRDARRNAQTFDALKGLTNVEVRLQKYYPCVDFMHYSIPINSIHQKIVVVSVNNVKCALVGGFNIITPSYFDDFTHPMSPDNKGNRNFHSWHDCAVFLQGPVVDLIEKEFNRRWNQTSPNAKVTNQGTYAKVACWQINHDSCLDEFQVCSEHKPSKIPYQNPITGKIQYPIDVMITTAQFKEAVLQVKQKLLDQIQAAQKYIYFENFTFHNVDLIRAIIRKLESAPQDFRCIILIPHPTISNDHEDQLGQFYMCRMAFAAMLLSTNEWDHVAFKHGDIVTLDECDSWNINIPDGKPIEYATFNCKRKSSGETRKFPIVDVISVESKANSRLIFTSPVRYFNSLNPNEEKYQLPGLSPNFRSIYVHSKVALFDDNYALVGSANFNDRSLSWDVECSVGCANTAKAKEIREELFKHWGIDTPQNWRTAMTDFANSPTERVGVVPLSISCLTSVPPAWYWNYITAVVDPSDLF